MVENLTEDVRRMETLKRLIRDLHAGADFNDVQQRVTTLVGAVSPEELAPVKQEQLQWPLWGNHVESKGKGGEAPALPEAKELLALYEAWQRAPDTAERTRIWKRMLAIHADQQFTIGTVTSSRPTE
jgi:ABC-type transport system substrate-binding protein